MIKIRKAKGTDFEDIWDIFHQVVKKGDTFAFDPKASKEDCKALWISPPVHTYVAELHNIIYTGFLPVLMLFDIVKSTLITQGFQVNLILFSSSLFWYILAVRYGKSTTVTLRQSDN